MNCVSLDQLHISLDNLFVMIPPTVNVADCPVESIPPLVLRKSSFILKVHPIQGLETFYGLQINRMARKDTFNQRGVSNLTGFGWTLFIQDKIFSK